MPGILLNVKVLSLWYTKYASLITDNTSVWCIFRHLVLQLMFIYYAVLKGSLLTLSFQWTGGEITAYCCRIQTNSKCCFPIWMKFLQIWILLRHLSAPCVTLYPLDTCDKQLAKHSCNVSDCLAVAQKCAHGQRVNCNIKKKCNIIVLYVNMFMASFIYFNVSFFLWIGLCILQQLFNCCTWNLGFVINSIKEKSWASGMICISGSCASAIMF